jgi:NADH-quinone oxidoreductase subunit M
MASLGLPGLGNFAAEFLVLNGSFPSGATSTMAASAGLVLAAVYALPLFQRAFHGPAREHRTLRDLGARELFMMSALVAALLWLGLHPQPVLGAADRALEDLLARVER